MKLSRFLQLPELPSSMDLLWGVWRSALRPAARVYGDGIVKAFVWSILLTRNDYIFADKCDSPITVMMKAAHLLLSWFSAAPEGLRAKLGNPTASIRRSLEFAGPRSEGVEVAPTLEVNQGGGEE